MHRIPTFRANLPTEDLQCQLDEIVQGIEALPSDSNKGSLNDIVGRLQDYCTKLDIDLDPKVGRKVVLINDDHGHSTPG